MNEGRKEIIQAVFILIGIIFLVKLFFIQVVDDRYGKLAGINAILPVPQYPIRGTIYDRNNKLIVYNNPEFDLMIIGKDVKRLDSTRFCQVFGISREHLDELFATYMDEIEARKASELQPYAFIRQLSTMDLARIEDNIDEFPGFYIEARNTRAYASIAGANALGYVSEITKKQLDRKSVV